MSLPACFFLLYCGVCALETIMCCGGRAGTGLMTTRQSGLGVGDAHGYTRDAQDLGQLIRV